MKIYMACIDRSDHQDGTIILDAQDGCPVEMAFVNGRPAWLWRKNSKSGGSLYYVKGRYLLHHRLAGRGDDNALEAIDVDCLEVSGDELLSMFFAEMGKFVIRQVDEEMGV